MREREKERERERGRKRERKRLNEANAASLRHTGSFWPAALSMGGCAYSVI